MNLLIDRIFRSYEDTIIRTQDLLGEARPSLLFYMLAPVCRHLLNYRSEKLITKESMCLRKMLHPFLMMLSPLFLDYNQVIEKKTDIPDDPVIWCSNHGFKDDIMASIKAAGRHTYILFGSLPVCMNTLDGLGAYLNGIVLCNRKIKESRAASYVSCKKVIELGCDLLIFPEGVWNKTPNRLLLDFWPGAVRLARETGRPIVPVVHYLADPHKNYSRNVIHTAIGDPFFVNNMTEEEGIQSLRDMMATMYYQLMEKYGKSSREELLGVWKTADEAWENYLSIHTGKIKYYDREMEISADYKLRSITHPVDVWRQVTELDSSISFVKDHICYARKIVAQETRRDFQHRY